tara:strand:+ start:2574 stop:2765 length:192 start_codon:yes stop_codon:yes gene_type:complete
MTFTPNKILELYAKEHGTNTKAYKILKRSLNLELTGGDKKNPSDIVYAGTRSDKKIKRGLLKN